MLADEVQQINDLQITRASRLYKYAQKYSLTQYEILYLMKQKTGLTAPLALQKDVENMKAISKHSN